MKNRIYIQKDASNGQMNSYIVTSEFGKVIVIDGGYRRNAEHLLEVLREVTGQEKPHIDMWILTHPHLDHVDAFLEVVEKHFDEVEIGKICYNFPSTQFLLQEDESAAQTNEEFFADLPIFADKICIASTRDVYEFENIKIEVLYSADAELNMNVGNNSSLVFKMTVGDKTIMFTGDCGVEAGQKIVRMWADSGKLKCDICQMAHHGQNGCDRNFYEIVNPQIALWNTPDWLWNNDAGKGYNTHVFRTVEVRQWMEELGCKINYITKDGDQVCEL